MTVQTQPPTAEAFLSRFLAERDMPCPLCRYNLRNLATNRCPECGEELQLVIGLVEPRMAPYIAALVGSCLGLGGSLLFCLVALVRAPSQWWREPGALLLLVQLVLSGMVLVTLLRQRRVFRRAPRTVQLAWACGIGAGVAILYVLVIAFFD